VSVRGLSCFGDYIRSHYLAVTLYAEAGFGGVERRMSKKFWLLKRCRHGVISRGGGGRWGGSSPNRTEWTQTSGEGWEMLQYSLGSDGEWCRICRIHLGVMGCFNIRQGVRGNDVGLGKYTWEWCRTLGQYWLTRSLMKFQLIYLISDILLNLLSQGSDGKCYNIPQGVRGRPTNGKSDLLTLTLISIARYYFSAYWMLTWCKTYNRYHRQRGSAALC